jgi:hypothetical protein
MTIEEAIISLSAKGFFVDQKLGGLRICSDGVFEPYIQGFVYKKGIIVLQIEGDWKLLSLGLTYEPTFSTFEEALIVAERCLTDDTYSQELWEQAKEKILKEQHDTSP